MCSRRVDWKSLPSTWILEAVTGSNHVWITRYSLGVTSFAHGIERNPPALPACRVDLLVCKLDVGAHVGTLTAFNALS